MEWKSNRRVLIIGGPKALSQVSLAPHETVHAKNLESALGVINAARPDLVVYFAKGKEDILEEHVLTWLIEGFRGKFLLFDPQNKVEDASTLLQSQVIDDYFSGPIGPARFLTIVKNRLAQDSHFAPPRAMTTFDLFRNLFERGLNAIFFFSERLDRCVVANIRAEQITGRTLRQLRHLSLQDLCAKSEYTQTLRVIRRAGRHYYDSTGETILKGPERAVLPVSFSCGVFNFGRKNFIKVEVQKVALETATRRSVAGKKWLSKPSLLALHYPA